MMALQQKLIELREKKINPLHQSASKIRDNPVIDVGTGHNSPKSEASDL